MNKKEILSSLVDANAQNVRILQDTHRTIGLEVTMLRADYEKYIEPHLDENAIATHDFWVGELCHIELVGERSESTNTGGGTYRYTILVFK